MYCQLLLLFSYCTFVFSSTTFHSHPFTGFRHECPDNSAVKEINVWRYEVGKRKDYVFTTVCGEINKMFPSRGKIRFRKRFKRQIQQENADCGWESFKFDPLDENDIDDTCPHGRYMAGVSRRFANRLEVLCCLVPERQLEDCHPKLYPLPTKGSPVVQVYLKDNIIASIKLQNGRFKAVFCKLLPKESTPAPLPSQSIDDLLDSNVQSENDDFLRLFSELLNSGSNGRDFKLIEATTTTTTTTPAPTTTKALAVFNNLETRRNAIEKALGQKFDKSCSVPEDGPKGLEDLFSICNCFLKEIMKEESCSSNSPSSLLLCVRLLTFFQ